MPIDPATVGLVTGVLSAGGQVLSNRQSHRSTREQMRFQERMDSTRAQRAVADYKAAGLNPALAYDKPAGSPAGASTDFQNVAEKGVSSGVSAKMAAQQVANLEAQTKLLGAQTLKANAEAVESAARAAPWQTVGPNSVRDLFERGLREDLLTKEATGRFTRERQPVDLRLLNLEETLKGYSREGLTRRALERFGPSLMSNARSIYDRLPKPRFK